MQCVHVSTKLIQVNYNTDTIQYNKEYELMVSIGDLIDKTLDCTLLIRNI